MQAREIMTENPVCCVPSDSVRIIARMMKENNCGLIPVVNDMQMKQLVGVVTDRDLACRILAEQDCTAAVAGDAMTSGKLWTVQPSAPIDEVIEQMEEGQVRRIPVVDENNLLLGIISTADIALEADDPEEIAEVFEEISEPTHQPHT